MMWKFCGKAQFPQSFGQVVQNSTETVRFHKISTPRNLLKFVKATAEESFISRFGLYREQVYFLV